MPRFKVWIVDRSTEYRSKVFEAATQQEARELAEADESWTDLADWQEEDLDGFCEISSIEEL